MRSHEAACRRADCVNIRCCSTDEPNRQQPASGTGRQHRLGTHMELASVKARIPWPIKIAAKVVLTRLPISDSVLRRSGLMRRGRMERPEYAYELFRKHFDRAPFARRHGGYVFLELGPGDSLGSALVGHALGAAEGYLVDVGAFALTDMECYRDLATFLRARGVRAPELSRVDSVAEMLTLCNVRYLTGGVVSLRQIPSESVDFIWSYHVLEHVRRAEFIEVMRHLRRALRADGICSLSVDLKDHLSYALNNLRFSERVWESEFVVRSRIYTNRIRYSEMLALFGEAGFDVEVIGVKRWPQLPTARRKLNKAFRGLSDEELRVSEFDVLLRRA